MEGNLRPIPLENHKKNIDIGIIVTFTFLYAAHCQQKENSWGGRMEEILLPGAEKKLKFNNFALLSF